MKLLIIACLSLPLLCSAASSPSSFWEYLLVEEQTLKSFTAGKIWSDCTKASDHGKIIDIILTPDPPKRGADIVVNSTVSIDEEVTAGKVTGVVTLGSVPYQQEYDLCDLVNYVDLSCPIPKGTLSIVMKMNVPDYAPPGDYKGQAIATDQNKERIFCVNLNMHLD